MLIYSMLQERLGGNLKREFCISFFGGSPCNNRPSTSPNPKFQRNFTWLGRPVPGVWHPAFLMTIFNNMPGGRIAS
jgi:hypothetical protein